jgi:hypothetical protein
MNRSSWKWMMIMMIQMEGKRREQQRRKIETICRRTLIRTAAKKEQAWNPIPNQMDRKE